MNDTHSSFSAHELFLLVNKTQAPGLVCNANAIAMGDDELKALLDAVAKLQPLLADPSHFSQLTLLREQVDRITALAGAQAAPNAQPPGDSQGEGAASVAGVRASSSHRRTGEPFEGGTPSARVQPNFGSRLKGEKFEGEPPSRGGQPSTNARPTDEYLARSTKGHGDHMARQPAPEVRFTGYSGEPPTSTQSPAMPSRLPWEQVERIASLVGQHSISNSRTQWDHVERVSFMAGAQPASSTRVAMEMNAGAKGVTPTSDKQTSKTQGGDEDCSEYGPPQDSLNERIYKTGKWTPAETLTLVHLRRGHFIKYPAAPHRRNVKASAAERWAEVEEEMFKRNIMRSKSQCQEKWEQLASDFRKVYDHQRNHVPLGEPGYFQMNSAERKERMLRFPKAQLDEAVYNALCEWYSRSSNVTDPGDLPIDTSFDVNAATPSGGNLGNIPATEPPASEELRPTHEDGIGDSSSPNLTKRRRLSTKASEGAFSAIENPQKENLNTKESLNINSLLVGQDREDARHRLMLEMDAKKHREMLELKARIHQDKIIIEKERLQRSAALGQSYIAAMLSIADALKVIGENLKKD